MTHAEIYNRVCEARPECAASLVAAAQDGCGTYLVLDGVPCAEGDEGDRDTVLALAIITDHWTEMLPDGCFLCPCDGIHTDNRVWYIDKFAEAPHPLPTYSPTRFHALAEFLVPGSTKEKA